MKYGIVFAIFIFCNQSEIYGQNNVRSELEKIIAYDTKIDHGKTPGFIVAVIDNDSSFIEYFGESLSPNDKRLTNQTTFQYGGVSKVITSIIVQDILHEKGLSIADKIYPVLHGSIKNKFQGLDWTFLSLLNHTSGLPKVPTYKISSDKKKDHVYEDFSKDKLEELILLTEKNTKNKFQYSHIDYAILGYVIESITHMSFDQIVNTWMQKYIGLHSLSLSSQDDLGATPGYTRGRRIVTGLDYGSFNASLGIKGSVSDLVSITRQLIVDYNSGNHRQHLFTQTVNTEINKRLHFTSGLYQMQPNKRAMIYTHSGRSNGHYAFMGLVPETLTGVVILANSIEGTEDLGLLVLRMINNSWKRKKNG